MKESGLNDIFKRFYAEVKKYLAVRGLEEIEKNYSCNCLGLISLAADLYTLYSRRNLNGFNEIKFLSDNGTLYHLKISHTDETKEELKKIKEKTINE